MGKNCGKDCGDKRIKGWEYKDGQRVPVMADKKKKKKDNEEEDEDE